MSFNSTFYQSYHDPNAALISSHNLGSLSSKLMNDRIKYNGTINQGNIVTMPVYEKKVRGGRPNIQTTQKPASKKPELFINTFNISPITGKEYSPLPNNIKLYEQYNKEVLKNLKTGIVPMQARTNYPWQGSFLYKH